MERWKPHVLIMVEKEFTPEAAYKYRCSTDSVLETMERLQNGVGPKPESPLLLFYFRGLLFMCRQVQGFCMKHILSLCLVVLFTGCVVLPSKRVSFNDIKIYALQNFSTSDKICFTIISFVAKTLGLIMKLYVFLRLRNVTWNIFLRVFYRIKIKSKSFLNFFY